jgi:ParB family chromosome partitioning protein
MHPAELAVGLLVILKLVDYSNRGCFAKKFQKKNICKEAIGAASKKRKTKRCQTEQNRSHIKDKQITRERGTKKTRDWGTTPMASSSSGQALDLHYETVRVSDVVVVDSEHRRVNEEVASRIADSIRANGLLHPIVVRRQKVVGDFGEREDAPILLVAGRNRLRAAELLGLKEIPAIFFKGDRRHARLAAIEENLFRKDLGALERAEHYAAWLRIVEHLEVSGQDVRKPKGGRPEGALSKLARELPISGKTVEARRKTMERSKAIAGIYPNAKEAIKKAKLDNNQKALCDAVRKLPR